MAYICCKHEKHSKGLEDGTIHPFDTLMEFWQKCNDHEPKNQLKDGTSF